MKKNGFVGIFVLLIVIIIVAVGGWHVFKTQKIQVNESPKLTNNSNLKEYTTKGALKLDFPKLSFSYPASWIVAEDSNSNGTQDNVTISKSGYVISIDQELIGGAGACYFKDSPTIAELNSPGRDLQTVDYMEMDSNFGHLRYFRFLSDDGNPTNTYAFCVKDIKKDTVGKNVYFVPNIGYIYLTVPAGQLNDVVFQEALNIIKSVKPLN